MPRTSLQVNELNSGLEWALYNLEDLKGETDWGGTERKRHYYKSIGRLSVTDGAMDLSTHDTVKGKFFRGCVLWDDLTHPGSSLISLCPRFINVHTCAHSAEEDSFASGKHFWEHHNRTWNIHLRSMFWLQGHARTRPVVPHRAQARMYLFSRPPLACTHSAPAPTVPERSYPLYIQRSNGTNASLYVIVKRGSRAVAARRGTAARTQCHFTDFVVLLSHFVRRQPSPLFDGCREGHSRWLWIMFTPCCRRVTVLVHAHE